MLSELRTDTGAARFGIFLGTAGWSIPRDQATRFPGTEPHLRRYAAVMRCAEINSTFYRPHRPSTYARWAASTPEGFQFAVKVPKAITHECGLEPMRERIATFLDELKPLAPKAGPWLLQLPPKQAFVEPQARSFLGLLRKAAPEVRMVMEPRHPGWFTPEAAELLREFRMNRVIADPLPARISPVDEQPESLAYYRLHGSPRVYYSSYSDESLAGLAGRIKSRLARGEEVWCIFDNTASGAALGDAVRLMALL